MKNRLKELRQMHQWSQADLARELGVSRQAVNGFESGKFDPSLEMAFRIASLFQVAIEAVFIYEVKPVQTFIERVKNFLGFEFGFERFTEPAINAISFARNQAAQQNSQVQPAHLLVGLLADPATTSAQLLRASGAQLEIDLTEESFERQNPDFNSQSKFVLELALQVVRLQGKKTIGTEHLLWGLVQLAVADQTVLDQLFEPHKIDIPDLSNRLRTAI